MPLATASIIVEASLVGDLSGGGSTRVQDNQDDGESSTGSDTLSLGGVCTAVLANLKADISGKRVDLLSTQLVVNQTSQGNGVTEELLGGDGVTEDHHRGADQEDILQDTSHGEDNSGGLANLWNN